MCTCPAASRDMHTSAKAHAQQLQHTCSDASSEMSSSLGTCVPATVNMRSNLEAPAQQRRGPYLGAFRHLRCRYWKRAQQRLVTCVTKDEILNLSVRASVEQR
jgi:hypothetical protein